MSIDPNKIIPEDVEQSYEGLQPLKDFIPKSNATAAEVRDSVRKLTAFMYKYLEQLTEDGV
jgi:hypothetical protein